MLIRFKFETSRFDPLFIERRMDKNLRPGQDLAWWLEEHLKAMGHKVPVSRQAGDELWVLEVMTTAAPSRAPATPLLAMGGQSAGNDSQPAGNNDRRNDDAVCYMIGIRMSPEGYDRQMAGSMQAEWCLSVEKNRSLMERILFRNRLTDNDALCQEIEDLLRRQFDFTRVSRKKCMFGP